MTPHAPWDPPTYLATSGALMMLPPSGIVAELQRTRAAVVQKEFSL